MELLSRLRKRLNPYLMWLGQAAAVVSGFLVNSMPTAAWLMAFGGMTLFSLMTMFEWSDRNQELHGEIMDLMAENHRLRLQLIGAQMEPVRRLAPVADEDPSAN